MNKEWKFLKFLYQDGKCINLYPSIKRELCDRKSWYQDLYNLSKGKAV